MRQALALLVVAVLLPACPAPPASPSTTVSFDLDGNLDKAETFFDLPWPSDLRLTERGTPDLAGFPNPRTLPLVEGLRTIAGERLGFPVVPVAYFKLSAPIAARDPDTVLAADKASPLLLVDVDPASPDRGQLLPTVAVTPPGDDYVPDNLLAMAPRPGFVLVAHRKYAFVVLRSLNDDKGKPLGQPAALAQLAAMQTPTGKRGAAAKDLYAPLWATLDMLGVSSADVAAATVFTTGDVVADLADLSTKLVAKYPVQITDLAVDPTDGATHDRFCELHGNVVYPQFQKGLPPFNSKGLFELGTDGLPIKQRDETAPIAITIPKTAMPPGGYPLLIYFHGSGGASVDAVDRGPSSVKDGPPAVGLGPAWVHGAFGVGTAASALPVNPERLPGAPETAYLNLNNLPAFRDTFRQGVIEQRLFIEALSKIAIDPSVLGACTRPTLPNNETAYHFNVAGGHLVAQGQSMGGMYTNMIGAVEPRIKAVVPTGAGGFWSYFILKTTLINKVATLVAGLLGSADLTFLHPTMQLLELAWEPTDPFVYMPRLARRPLPGHPVRPIFEPVGKDDSYFPTVLYDAVALSYGHQQAGTEVWPTMQPALKLAGLNGILSYPIRQNRTGGDGATKYTGVVVQYAGDGFEDPHAIYRQLDAVKYQYGCFVSTFLANGVAVVPAPAALGTACPQ